MNCLDFRRAAQAQPRALPPDALEHAATCPACAAVLERERLLDDRLAGALGVPVPEGLADRVLVAHGLRRRFSPVRWALAASLVLAAGLAWTVPPALAGQRLAREAIAHVEEEPEALQVRLPRARSELASMLAAQGLRLAAEVGDVVYFQNCPMGEGEARHLVLQTAEGPVTLLLLPGDEVSRRRMTSSENGQFAVAMPAPRGSVAIVAGSASHASAVARMIVPA
jgi:hypothetical protein